jgi:hypothetical protein
VVISTGIASDWSVISPADRIEPRGEFAPLYREDYRRYQEIYRYLRPAADPIQS